MSETQTETQTNQPVPYERFQEVVAQKNEMKSRLDEAIGKLTATEEERNKFKADFEQVRKDAEKSAIAKKYNLPNELVSRLTGNTAEELEKDAELLSKLFVKENPGVPDVPRGSETTVPKDLEEKVLQIFKDRTSKK